MKTALHLLRGLMASVIVSACVCVWSVAAAAPAQSVVDNLDSQLLATMKQGQTLGFAGRYKQLAPVIDKSFDLPRIAKLALGDSWAKLNADQQKQYVEMFRKDTLATYASRFTRFSGEQFQTVGSKDAPGGRQEVDTLIITKSGDKTPINYVLDNSGGNWQIVNVVAKGVSDLALKRGQYTGAIRDKGADGFLAQFREQLKKYPPLPDVPPYAGRGDDA